MAGRFRSEAGYSLVEVMVAIMLLTLAIIPMVSMFDAGLRAAVLGSNYDKARALANERLEEVKALPYEEVVSRYAPGPPTSETRGIFTYTVETTYMSLDTSGISEGSRAGSMMKVEVEVRWEDNNSYSTTGLVSRD